MIADDFGIGPATSAGILDLAEVGVVTGTVLLTNSPYAEEAVRLWQRAGMPAQLGWHPNLTMDRPVLPPERVPSLLQANGRFHDLAGFLARLFSRRISGNEIRAELNAQYARFLELVGRPPAVVNGHKHIHVFPVVGAALRDILSRQSPRPFMRRNREPLGVWLGVPGARCKRLVLSAFGSWAAQRQRRRRYPGADYLAGVTDPRWVKDPVFFTRWLARMPGTTVELMVHPGHLDDTLVDRDCLPGDGQAQRRVDELRLLQHPSFYAACQAAGFELRFPSYHLWHQRGGRHVA